MDLLLALLLLGVASNPGSAVFLAGVVYCFGGDTDDGACLMGDRFRDAEVRADLGLAVGESRPCFTGEGDVGVLGVRPRAEEVEVALRMGEN